MKHMEAIVLSHDAEGAHAVPSILNGSRRKRIASGSGRPVVEMNQLLKQFDMMRQMMGNKGMMGKLMGGMMGGGGMPGMPGGDGWHGSDAGRRHARHEAPKNPEAAPGDEVLI